MATTTPEATIMEEKEELMVSPKFPNIHNPTRKIAHFLKPSATSINNVKPFFFNPKKVSLNVSFNGWRFPSKDWKLWVNTMHSLHKSTWIKAGICNAVLNSLSEIPKNQDLVLGFAEKWCHETKTFVFQWGEATITLEDMMVLGGFSVLGEYVVSPAENEESKTVLAKLIEARVELGRSKRRKACQGGWIKMFKDSNKEIEHEAFLIMWLSRFVFPSSYDLVMKNVFTIAVHLARGVKLALAPAVLATIYRDLSLLKNSDHNDETLITVWAPFQVVQIWIWKRFPKLSPNPGDTCNPRFRRREKKKLHINNVGSYFDRDLEDFRWQPYGEKENDDLGFCNLYQENGRWVVVGDRLDEETESWARCLRVSQLVGLNADCIQQYLPHRVAMQFGMDQDIPGDVAQANANPEIAWEFYNRPVKDVKLYFPSCFAEPFVTSRYVEWRKKSSGVPSLQSLFGTDEPEKLVIDDEIRNDGSLESVSGLGSNEVEILGLGLEARIKKLEEAFAYLKDKKKSRVNVD